MRNRFTTSALVLAAGAIALAAHSPFAPPQDPAMEKPSAHHQRVLEAVGSWEGTLTMFVPDMPPTPVAAREHVEAVGQFWTRSRFECDFMGQPYVGAGCVGYSAADQKYVGTWIDSMTSHLALMEGDYDTAKDLLVMHWEAPDESGDSVPHRMELKSSADSYTSTFFMGEGDGTRSMVIEMKRVKKAAK